MYWQRSNQVNTPIHNNRSHLYAMTAGVAPQSPGSVGETSKGMCRSACSYICRLLSKMSLSLVTVAAYSSSPSCAIIKRVHFDQGSQRLASCKDSRFKMAEAVIKCA